MEKPTPRLYTIQLFLGEFPIEYFTPVKRSIYKKSTMRYFIGTPL